MVQAAKLKHGFLISVKEMTLTLREKDLMNIYIGMKKIGWWTKVINSIL